MNGLNSGRMQWEMYRLELVQESHVPFHLLMASYVSIYSVFIERFISVKEVFIMFLGEYMTLLLAALLQRMNS